MKFRVHALMINSVVIVMISKLRMLVCQFLIAMGISTTMRL